MGSIRALDTQFQRMSVAAPIKSLAPTVAHASSEVNNRPEESSYQPLYLPKGWITLWDDMSHKHYFVQLSNGASQWETPTHAALGPEAIPQGIEYPYNTPCVEEGSVNTNQDNHCLRSKSYKQERPAYCRGSYRGRILSLECRNWWLKGPRISGCIKCGWQLRDHTAMKIVLSNPNDTTNDENLKTTFYISWLFFHTSHLPMPSVTKNRQRSGRSHRATYLCTLCEHKGAVSILAGEDSYSAHIATDHTLTEVETVANKKYGERRVLFRTLDHCRSSIKQ
jgi:hypothetical protein